MLGNNLVLKNVDKFEENMQVQYLLKNNTLLKTKQDISSVEEHVITYTLAKAQKKLIQMFDKKSVYNTSQFPSEIAVTVSNNEIKSICDNRQYYGKAGLQKLCDALGSIRMNFVSYIDGYHTNTALIKSFKWSEDNPDEIIISIDKEVYLFLIDYTLNLKGSNIIIDEIKTPDGLKKKDTNKNNDRIENAVFNIKEKSQYAKGYSRIELSFFKDIKNVYARNIFYDLKAAIENNKVYNSNASKIEKTYTIESLRERFMLENKYARFTDFNSRVLKTIKSQINDSEYMVIDYTCQTKKARGGNKVVAVTFVATITEKLLSLDAKYNTVLVPQKEQQDTSSTLAEGLSNKVRQEGKLNVGVKTFNELIDTYSESIVKRAVLALLSANEKERIKAPKRWLLRTLEDMQTRENGYVVQQGVQGGINPMKFNNFKGRDYSQDEWDSMEKRLLGWDDSDTENTNI